MALELAARRVIEIQNVLLTETLCSDHRNQLIKEQRDLWNNKFPGSPYDAILRVATIN